ncbi:MAG: putative cytidylyltransferase [Prokaryotic dsDNA virus sp.]|nr:MAG: putative cytidylyltransferase [Prokaryotic dsDNA virus sp.]|tara:strand:- start:1011 stop:1751 length:741 start_codon:yes stop_codon:yes gene_type:complete
MNIYALQTARAGSKSVPNKNIMDIKGKPLYLHNVLYALESDLIKDVYVSTDYDIIHSKASHYGYKSIARPEHLCLDDSSHRDTMLHGLEEIEKDTGETCDYLVVLFGNTLGARTIDLDNAINMIINNPELDSVQSVSEYTMFNPFRAFKIENGMLNTIVDQDFIKNNLKGKLANDRNSAGKSYFMNGSFWIIKKQTLIDNNGLLPFPFLGSNIGAYIQDTMMEIDAPWQIKFLESGLGYSTWPFKE